jgi:zinc protease
MKLYRILLVFAFSSHVIYAQIDESCLTGKLANGLTYYIKRNDLHSEKASLRLVVKVGSIYETEEERGLAHFLEHMVFRGSENFADWEIIQYLESIGAEFGPDTNAFTAFEETSYLLQVPMEKKENLETALLILSDFAGRAALKDELIEIERTVVLDECKCSENHSGMKIWRQTFQELFQNSAYYNRFPIGSKEVILNCDPQIIRDFYKKWYRPNRMAVIAVGDFDETEVKKIIEGFFGGFEAGDDAIISTKVLFPADPRSLFIQETEEAFVQGAFIGFYEADCLTKVTDQHIKASLVSNFASAILNQRLDQESKKHPAPYLYGGVFAQPFTTFHQALRIHFIGFMDRPADGLRTVCREVERCRQFGPTNGEVDRIISQAREEIEQFLANLDRVENDSIIQDYHNHFLCEVSYRPRELEMKLKKKLIEEITKQDIQDWLQQNIHLDRMYTVFSMPEEVISFSEFQKILEESKQEILEPFEEEENRALIVSAIGADSIKSVTENSKIGATTIVLENGMKVVLHPTALEAGRIFIDLVANGGKTLFKPEEYASQEVATSYLAESGLANLNGIQLKHFLRMRNSHLGVEIAPHTRTIQAIGPTQESESLFQLIRAVFLEKRGDPLVWDSIIAGRVEIEKHKNNRPEASFFESANKVIYDGHPFYEISDPLEATQEGALKVLERAFGYPEEFSVAITGDFDIAEIEALICKYFHFPEKRTKESQQIDLPNLKNVSAPRTEIVYQGKETHGLTLVAYRKNCSSISEPALKALIHILSERCLKKMRRELGETYSPSFIYEFPLNPLKESVCVAAYFSSIPEKSEGLKEAVLGLIHEFLEKGLTEDEVSSAKEIQRQQIKEAKIRDQFWVNLHAQALIEQKSFEEIEYELLNLETITLENLQKIGSELFSENPVIRISLFPAGN